MTERTNAESSIRRRSGGRPVHKLAPEIERRWKAAKATGQQPSGKRIWNELKREYPRADVKLRTVQQHVFRLAEKYRMPLRTEPPKIEWQAWRDESLDSESAAYLLRLNAVSKAIYGQNRPLWTTEAEWTVRLRVALDGLEPFVQLFVVREYALRNRVAVRIGETQADTADLDELLGRQPWSIGSRDAWRPTWLFFYQMQEPGAVSSALLDWLIRSLLGIREQAAQIDWRDIARAASERTGYDGWPWSLSDVLFPEQRGST